MTAAAIIPAALPSLPLEERKALPATAGIYFVLAGDAVLYIGKATNLYQRWDAHHRLKQLNKRGGCRIAWMQVDDAGLLNELEQVCITHFDPVLNGTGVTGRPHQISITLPDAILADVQAWASAKAIPAATLIRQWVAERVAQERQQAEARQEQPTRS